MFYFLVNSIIDLNSLLIMENRLPIDYSKFQQSQMETFAQLAMVVKECVGKDELLPAADMLTLFCRVSCLKGILI